MQTSATELDLDRSWLKATRRSKWMKWGVEILTFLYMPQDWICHVGSECYFENYFQIGAIMRISLFAGAILGKNSLKHHLKFNQI